MTTSRDHTVTKRPASDAVGRGTASPSSWGLFVGGKEIAPRTGQWFTTIDPATEEPLAEVARAGVEDVENAVGVARRAFRRSWGELPGRERAKYLFRIARLLQERSRELAVLETLDTRKPLK